MIGRFLSCSDLSRNSNLLAYSVVCWRQLGAPTQESGLSTLQKFCELVAKLLVGGNWQGQGLLNNRNWQTLQIRASPPSCQTFTSMPLPLNFIFCNPNVIRERSTTSDPG